MSPTEFAIKLHSIDKITRKKNSCQSNYVKNGFNNFKILVKTDKILVKNYSEYWIRTRGINYH